MWEGSEGIIDYTRRQYQSTDYYSYTYNARASVNVQHKFSLKQSKNSWMHHIRIKISNTGKYFLEYWSDSFPARSSLRSWNTTLQITVSIRIINNLLVTAIPMTYVCPSMTHDMLRKRMPWRAGKVLPSLGGLSTDRIRKPLTRTENASTYFRTTPTKAVYTDLFLTAVSLGLL